MRALAREYQNIRRTAAHPVFEAKMMSSIRNVWLRDWHETDAARCISESGRNSMRSAGTDCSKCDALTSHHMISVERM